MRKATTVPQGLICFMFSWVCRGVIPCAVVSFRGVPWCHSVSREILEAPDRTVYLFSGLGLFAWQRMCEEDFHVGSLSCSSCSSIGLSTWLLSVYSAFHATVNLLVLQYICLLLSLFRLIAFSLAVCVSVSLSSCLCCSSLGTLMSICLCFSLSLCLCVCVRAHAFVSGVCVCVCVFACLCVSVRVCVAHV